MKLGKTRWAALLLAGLMITTPAPGATVLQCVPYARNVSGVQIHGDALTWWDQAENHYKRGHSPRRGAVLAFVRSAQWCWVMSQWSAGSWMIGAC